MTDKVAEALRDEKLATIVARHMTPGALRIKNAREALSCPALHAAIIGLLTEAERCADKFRRMFDLKSQATKRFEPCSGHVGKVDNQRDGCPWCRAERAERLLSAADEVLRSRLAEKEQQRQREVEQADVDALVRALAWTPMQNGERLRDVLSKTSVVNIVMEITDGLGLQIVGKVGAGRFGGGDYD